MMSYDYYMIMLSLYFWQCVVFINFFFFRRIGFYLKQKICLRFGVSNIHSLLDMIDFNVKHLLKIWNVLFNKCYSGCMLKDLLGIIIMFPFCSICVSQEVWIMKKKMVCIAFCLNYLLVYNSISSNQHAFKKKIFACAWTIKTKSLWEYGWLIVNYNQFRLPIL